MADALREITSRPKRYENVDGTTEMSFGLMLFAFLLTAYLSEIVEKHSGMSRGFIPLVMLGILLPLIFIGAVLTRTIKNRITYPRTGYVAYRRIGKEKRWRAVLFAIGLCVAAAVIAAVVPLLQENGESSVLRGVVVLLFVAPYAAVVVNMSKELAWKKYVIIAMAIGLIAIVVLVGGSAQRLARPVMVFSGATWLASGLATLVVYIRRTHAPDGAE